MTGTEWGVAFNDSDGHRHYVAFDNRAEAEEQADDDLGWAAYANPALIQRDVTEWREVTP